MIDKLLPHTASAVEAFGDCPDVTLFPEEAAIVARAVDKRRREFATARGCARDALAKLGIAPCPILPGARGAPQWPSGIVGSITHCAGYRAAAVAFGHDLLTIGLDAEPDDVLPDGVLDAVASASERARVRELFRLAPGVSWDRLLFSAKESVYKAWFPLTQRWLGFEDADVVVDVAGRTFMARVLVPPPAARGVRLSQFSGRWLASDGLLLTAVTVPAPNAGDG